MADLGGGFLVFHGTLVGLDLVLKSTDDRLNGIPTLVKELRKLLLWLTLACLS